MKEQTIVFDGIKLTNAHTGMHRYMVECLRELDLLLEKKKLCVELVYPAFRKINCPKFRNISVRKLSYFSLGDIKRYGKRAAVVTTNLQWWERVLPRYLKRKDALFCGMMNDDPVGDTNLICLHDMLMIEPEAKYPQHLVDAYLRKFRLYQQKCKYLMTVSNTSKEDISSQLDFPKERITVTYNGWEHMQRIKAEAGVRQIHTELEPQSYYYSLGSITAHKNYKWIVETAKRNPDSIFAVAGKIGVTYGLDDWKLPNLHYLGRVSDGENKWLMENCKAFLHPSILEGFGIPPLEALSCGAPIIISNASCLPEIYEDCAHYIDPYCYDYNLDELLKQPVAPADKLLSKYSWKNSAKTWLQMIEKIISEKQGAN